MGSFVYRRIAQSSAIYGAGIVAARLASFALLPVYTRFLTTADYGTLELLDTTLYVFALLFGGRFAEALFYHYSSADNDAEKQRILSTVTAGAWLIGGIGAAVGLSLAPGISRIIFQDPSYARYFRIVFLSFGLSIPVEVGLARLRAMDRPALYVLVSLIRLCMTLGLTIYLVIFQRWQVWGVLLSNLTVTLLLAAALTAATLWQHRVHFSKVILWRTLRFALPLGVSGLGLFLIHFGDRFFLQRYAGLAQIGIYALAYKLGMLISQVQLAFGSYWTAQGYHALRGPDGPQIYARVNTYLMAAVLWAGLGIVSLTPPLLALIANPQYAPAARYVPWIVLAYVVRVEADYFRFIFYLDAATGRDAVLVWTAAGACLIGYAFLIPAFKLWGAVASTLMAFTILAAAARWFSYRRHAFPVERQRLLHLWLVAALLAAASLWIRPERSWLSWIWGLVTTFAYPLLLLATGFLRPGERESIVSALSALRLKLKSTAAP